MSMSSSAIRKRSNIWTCLLPSDSSTLSATPIPTRLYKIFDKAGESEACYQPGTLWCTSCWRNADKTFASRTTLLQIVIFKGFHFLLDILGLHTSLIYIINNKAIDPCFHEKINNLTKHSCKMEMECHAKFSRSAKQIRQMVNVINKLWQLHVCCKTYCSTTIQLLNRESQEIGAQADNQISHH